MKDHYYHQEIIEYTSSDSTGVFVDAVNAPHVSNYEDQYDNINLDPQYKTLLSKE